jgi:aminobenzoyl-glutamate transport protein
MEEASSRKGFVKHFLFVIEKVGNALPHPISLFAIFAILALIASWIVSLFGISVTHPGTGAIIEPINLLSLQGLHLILTKTITNFTSFAPLGVVIVAMLGIGVTEKTGLMDTVVRITVLSAPKRLLTFIIVFTGVMSNLASNVGYVLLIPLGAIIFLAVGRHPIAGLAAAFVGVSGGFSANLLIGSIDPLLAGISQEAAQIIDPKYFVNPACNYYFMIVSTFLVTIVGTFITEKVVEPMLGEYKGKEKKEKIDHLTSAEKRGLIYAGITFIILVAIALFGLIPEDGFFRNPITGSILKSPFLKGVVTVIFFGSLLLGIAYGIGAKTIKNDRDVIKGLSESARSLAMYIVLVFFAAQFIAYFNWSNLGLIVAVEGAEILKASNLGPIPLLIMFIFVSGFINLFMGSASAKWAIMAPVFIPMFMILGYSPELVQVTYRIGDSATNIIAPMMSYFALIIAYMEKYDPKAGIGTLVATMIPYSIALLIGWSILLIIWLLIGVPIGPGASLFL